MTTRPQAFLSQLHVFLFLVRYRRMCLSTR